MQYPRCRRWIVALTSLAAASACSITTRTTTTSTEATRAVMPIVDDDVVRARVAVADLLRAMNARDITELEARYAIRARTKEVSALARMLDRTSGPAEVRVHLLDDPTVSGESAHPLIQFPIEMRWVTAGGQARTQRVSMQASALREGGLFLIAAVRPPTDFNW